MRGNRATYRSDSGELSIQGDRPRRSAGRRRALRRAKAPGTDGNRCGFQVIRRLPVPRYPRFPRVPLAATPTPSAASSVRRPAADSSGPALHNKSRRRCSCKFREHKSFCRLPVPKMTSNFASLLFRTISDTENTFDETLPGYKCPQVSYMF